MENGHLRELGEAPKVSEEFSLGSVNAGLEKIRTRLLDLTARNKLLNYRHPKASSLRFVDTLPDAVFKGLIDGDTMAIDVVPESADGVRDSASPSSAEGTEEEQVAAKDYALELGWKTSFDLPATMDQPARLRVLAYQDDLDRTAKKIAGTARTSIEETGANVLHLCFGFLEWAESDSASTTQSPLLIMPVILEREKAPQNRGWVYRVQYSGDDLTTNLSLVEKMRRDFGVAIPYLREDETPSSYLDAVREAIAKRPGWVVRNFLSLALLSFGKQLMFLDLDPARWPSDSRITNHAGIKNLFEGVKATGLAFPDEYLIDEEGLQKSVPRLFYDADSSQHSALIDALSGKNLVIEGPPGTGKSQSITNLIASALLQGKSVLFVAEKSAALDVVYRRLDKIGLGLFCLALHSHRTQKRELLNGLERRLSARNTFEGTPHLEYKLSQADQTKGELNKYVRLLNLAHPQFGSTTFEIIWAKHRSAMALPANTPELDSLMIQDQERLSRAAYEDGKHATDLFVVTSKELFSRWDDLKAHPWYGVQAASISYVEQNQIFKLARTSIDLANGGADSIANLQGRGLALNETLGDLESCRSWDASFPMESTNPMLERLPSLDAEDARQKIRGFCDQTRHWVTVRAEIAQLGDVDAATYAYPTCLNKLFGLVDGTDLGELSTLDARTHEGRVTALLDQIPQARALFSWASSVFSSIPDSSGGLACLQAAVEALIKAPEPCLGYRHSALLQEDSIRTIRNAKEACDDLRFSARKLGEQFELGSLPSSSQLRGYAANLQDSNFLSRLFRRDCRDARSAFRRLSRSSESVPKSDVVAGFRTLADYKDRADAFHANNRFRQVAGQHYDTVNTPWQSLLDAAEWLSRAADTLGSAGNEVLHVIATISVAEVRTLRRQLEGRGAEIEAVNHLCELGKQTLDALPRSLACTWDGTLAGLGSDLKARAASLSELSSLGEQSGLNSNLSLDHVGVLLRLCHEESVLRSQAERLAKDLGLSDVFDGPATRIDEIRGAIDFAAAVDAANLPLPVRRWLLESFNTNSPILHRELGVHIALLTELRKTVVSLIDLAKLEIVHFWGYPTVDELQLRKVSGRLGRALDSPEDLAMYVDWLRSWDACTAATVPELPLLILGHGVTPDQLPSVYEFIFYNSLATSCINAHSDLMLFKGLAHEGIRSRFASLDREIMGLNAKYAASVLDARRVPAGNRSGAVGQWTDLSLIDHELAKQKRHIPIRQLVNRAADALKALKPCFMMSPLSVAQYLEPGRLTFDLVVMDEASQLKPEDALGAIARGGQLVVVGDPKQLPPSTFFERAMEDEEIDDDELTAAQDAESILDVATSIYQPVRRLRWHYRSRHHSLIEFSNHEFYKNLIVFPSAHSEHPELGVKLIEVPEGRFVNRRNEVEAQRVALAVVQHMRDRPRESLLVVALNAEQRDLIQDLLEHATMSDPFADAFQSDWKERSEPFSVKNLENVQGDERDVIFISTTYGPNEGGKQFQRFGPINGPHGHRRLNVLFTRAKKRVQVFSSLQTNNIITDGNCSWGVKVLRQYLEFAKSGRISEIPEGGGDPDSDFEVSVGYILKAAGYDIVPQVGVAGFFIDIGVKDPAIPGLFLAGIECDGATYHSAKSARDRDRLRQEILVGHGWRIYRIWSTDWFKNRKHEETRLLQFLSAAQLEAARESQLPRTEIG